MSTNKNYIDINKILLLNKPDGMSSNQALQRVKHLLHARKAGHGGSLDPLATGMLPILFGEATKFSQFLLMSDKKYLVTAKLGVVTATGDREGEVISTQTVPKLSADQLETVLAQFRGEIQQIPSMYSAIKHQGRPLYELARQGIVVERQARAVTIYGLSLISFNQDEITLTVHCSKGTYIRTLLEDIGQVLGCGAHVISLHRQTVGTFAESDMVSLETLQQHEHDTEQLNQYLRPVEAILPNWPYIHLSSAASFYLRRGQAIRVPRCPSNGWVRLCIGTDYFLGVGEILNDGRIAPRRLLKKPLPLQQAAPASYLS